MVAQRIPAVIQRKFSLLKRCPRVTTTGTTNWLRSMRVTTTMRLTTSPPSCSLSGLTDPDAIPGSPTSRQSKKTRHVSPREPSMVTACDTGSSITTSILRIPMRRALLTRRVFVVDSVCWRSNAMARLTLRPGTKWSRETQSFRMPYSARAESYRQPSSALNTRVLPARLR